MNHFFYFLKFKLSFLSKIFKRRTLWFFLIFLVLNSIILTSVTNFTEINQIFQQKINKNTNELSINDLRKQILAKIEQMKKTTPHETIVYPQHYTLNTLKEQLHSDEFIENNGYDVLSSLNELTNSVLPFGKISAKKSLAENFDNNLALPSSIFSHSSLVEHFIKFSQWYSENILPFQGIESASLFSNLMANTEINQIFPHLDPTNKNYELLNFFVKNVHFYIVNNFPKTILDNPLLKEQIPNEFIDYLTYFKILKTPSDQKINLLKEIYYNFLGGELNESVFSNSAKLTFAQLREKINNRILLLLLQKAYAYFDDLPELNQNDFNNLTVLSNKIKNYLQSQTENPLLDLEMKYSLGAKNQDKQTYFIHFNANKDAEKKEEIPYNWEFKFELTAADYKLSYFQLKCTKYKEVSSWFYGTYWDDYEETISETIFDTPTFLFSVISH